MWHEGTIGIPIPEGKYKTAKYLVKNLKGKSKYGINGGKVTELKITIGGEVVALYEKGWKVKPSDDDQQANIALYICLDQYN